MILKKLAHAIIHAIPAMLFFAVAFNLIVFTESLMLPPGQIQLPTYIAATIGALIIGKLLIIVNAFSFINLYARDSLIKNIAWKFFIYLIFAFILRVIERFVDTWIDYQFNDAYAQLQHELVSRVFWAVQLWIIMLLLCYVIATEFAHALGKDQLKTLLFKKPD